MSLNLNLDLLPEDGRQKLNRINEAIGDSIVELYDPEALILFGSYAHGEPDEWSDVDLLIVSGAFQTTPKLHRRSQFLINTEAYLQKGMDIEPLCLTPVEFLDGIQLATIEREALDIGVVLFDRTGITGRAKQKLKQKRRSPRPAVVRTFEEQKRRLGPVDQLEVQLVGQADSVRRYEMMYSLRSVIVNTWAGWMKDKYPDLSDIERSRLLFEKLQEDV